MKETLGFSWWPLQSPPRPPLAMAAGRGRRGEKPVIGHFLGGVPDGKTCRQAIFEGVYTLQGTDTYPTNREVRKISIDSSKVLCLLMGYVSSQEGKSLLYPTRW